MTVHFAWSMTTFCPLVECLRTLPNPHTLSIGRADDSGAAPLKNVLMGVNLLQIETLILPPAAYPLLQHCPNVEDVVCLINDTIGPSGDEFLRSLVSNRDSKLKRLAIPWLYCPTHSVSDPALCWVIGW